MTTVRVGTMMLALGLAVGAGASAVLRAPAVALAQQSMAGMNMVPKSDGDTELNAAMNRMNRAMLSTKQTGFVDRDFMTMMILHHQSAIDMANVELRRGTRPELKMLSRNVIKSQGKEIAQMRAWLKSWYGAHS